ADAAERALAILARRQVAPAQRASLELLLARASWDAGRDRTRALALARGVRDGDDGQSDARASLAREAAAWLATHDAP
ncbi:MAG: hypothetical protein K1X88_12650, partial [Nannocystaceae bacterium]|nr:hypothetical protein [Nannocystaceae bacterium]